MLAEMKTLVQSSLCSKILGFDDESLQCWVSSAMRMLVNLEIVVTNSFVSCLKMNASVRELLHEASLELPYHRHSCLYCCAPLSVLKLMVFLMMLLRGTNICSGRQAPIVEFQGVVAPAVAAAAIGWNLLLKDHHLRPY